MATGEKRCDWWRTLLGNDHLFTDVQLPPHITDQQFVSLLQQVSLSFSPPTSVSERRISFFLCVLQSLEGKYIHGLRTIKMTDELRATVWLHMAEVRDGRLGLRPRLYAGSVRDDSAAESALRQ